MLVKKLLGDEDPVMFASKTEQPEVILGAIRFRCENPSELLSSKLTKISTSFGGQGVGSKYLIEIRKTLVAYPYCWDFVNSLIHELRNEYESKDCPRALFPQGYEVERWICSPLSSSEQPSDEYLSSTPVSYALIGVSQLLSYHALVSCAFGGDFARARSRWSSSIGHSQGIMSALAIACGKDRDHFESYCKRVVKCLFWTGVRVQEQRVSKRQDNMLAVRGLTPEQLESYVKIVRAQTKETIAISLINGAKRCVVSGSSNSIEMLSVVLSDKKRNDMLPSALRIHFDSSSSQSRVPYVVCVCVCVTYSLTLTHSYSLIHTHSFILTHSYSHIHTHTSTLTHSHSHIHTHTSTLTQIL